MSDSFPLTPNKKIDNMGQVAIFRDKLKLRDDPSAVHCDANAIRQFVSLCLRRHDGHKRQVP